MKVFVKGKGEVSLTKKHFLAQGGQGSVFVKGKTAYKIYTDPKTMIPLAKIDELASLKLDTIINPHRVLLDGKNRPIGYTMAYVRDTYALCKYFTKAFKSRKGVTPDATLKLVMSFKKDLIVVHAQNILVVDLNEMNFLVNQGLDKIYFIDVDSYQTKNFHATAIMESIRDRHATHWSTLTDWFSWAIVSFQMFVGIHPYKGKHKSVKGLDDRMKQNISVFNPAVSRPKICLPFDVIPELYRNWYKAVFENGKRLAPPDVVQAIVYIQPTVKRIDGTDNFNVELIHKYDGNIISCVYIEGNRIAITSDGVYINDLQEVGINNDVSIASTPKMGHAIIANVTDNKLFAYDITRGKQLDSNIMCEKLMTYNGRIYVKHLLDIYEIQLIEVGQNILVSPKTVANVMEKATHLYDGVIVQDILGAFYVSVFPESGKCYQVRLKDLEGHKIVDAKYDNKVLMVIAEKKGTYYRFIFRFDDKYSEYDIRVVKDIQYSGINFIVLDNGLCIHINDDEELEIFPNKINATEMKVVNDPIINGQVTLMKRGTQVLFAKDNSLYRASMK